MSCNRQLDLGAVALERQGLLNDPAYIQGAGEGLVPVNPNVAPLSVNVSASILAQYVSFSVAPAGLGDPGPLQYAFSTHYLAHRDDATSPHCATETAEGAGDHRVCLTGLHKAAERQRQLSRSVRATIRLLRWVDNRAQEVTRWLDRIIK